MQKNTEPRPSILTALALATLALGILAALMTLSVVVLLLDRLGLVS